MPGRRNWTQVAPRAPASGDAEHFHMANVSVELLIILVLLLANGFLALSEIAIVSAKATRLLQRAERGDAAAAIAARLVASPTKFLSTVQVGITLIGILSGAYGGATIADEL